MESELSEQISSPLPFKPNIPLERLRIVELGHSAKRRQLTQDISIRYDASMDCSGINSYLQPLGPPFSCVEYSCPQTYLARSDSIA